MREFVDSSSIHRSCAGSAGPGSTATAYPQVLRMEAPGRTTTVDRARMPGRGGVTHIQLVVRDLERSLRFYTRVFGLEERFREGRHMVFLNTPASQDLITLN